MYLILIQIIHFCGCFCGRIDSGMEHQTASSRFAHLKGLSSLGNIGSCKILKNQGFKADPFSFKIVLLVFIKTYLRMEEIFSDSCWRLSLIHI